MKTLTQILKDSKAELEEKGVDTPIQDARLLLQHALKITYEELLLNSKRLITDIEHEALKLLLERRKKREPVSRIVGHRGFWKYDFKISPETLDPRPDSETMIEVALHYAGDEAGNAHKILDIGTGSGCLLLSLLGEWKSATGVGIDISQGAIDIAAENAKTLGFADRTTLKLASWDEYNPSAPFDIVISNPPYIAEHEMAGLEPEVVLFDPHRALVAGQDGLDAYRAIIARLPVFLREEGYLFLEIGHKQAVLVKELLETAGYGVLQTVPDLAGNDRVIVAKAPLKKGS